MSVYDVYTSLENEWIDFQFEMHEHKKDLKALGAGVVPPLNTPKGGNPLRKIPPAPTILRRGDGEKEIQE